MPKKKRGKSHSIRPLSRRSPSWCKYAPEEVEALTVKLAKEGYPPSQIGLILRDQHGIPMVKSIIGKKIVKILKENGLAPTIPEDLEALLKKATQLRTHLEKYRSDKYSKRSIQTIESRIRSLSEYYKKKGLLEKNWRYTRSTIINI